MAPVAVPRRRGTGHWKLNTASNSGGDELVGRPRVYGLCAIDLVYARNGTLPGNFAISHPGQLPLFHPASDQSNWNDGCRDRNGRDASQSQRNVRYRHRRTACRLVGGDSDYLDRRHTVRPNRPGVGSLSVRFPARRAFHHGCRSAQRLSARPNDSPFAAESLFHGRLGWVARDGLEHDAGRATRWRAHHLRPLRKKSALDRAYLYGRRGRCDGGWRRVSRTRADGDPRSVHDRHGSSANQRRYGSARIRQNCPGSTITRHPGSLLCPETDCPDLQD